MDRHYIGAKLAESLSYYISNQPALTHEQELFAAVRGHWRVESLNWIRDVIFNEDQVRTNDPNTGQILSRRRTREVICIMRVSMLRHTRPETKIFDAGFEIDIQNTLPGKCPNFL